MNEASRLPKRAKRTYYVRDSARSEDGVSLGKGDRGEGGAAAVEFAIVVTLLMLIVFGIIEFGVWISEYEAMTSGAREGARAAAVEQDICPDDPRVPPSCDGKFTNADVVAAVDEAIRPYTVGPGTPTFSIAGSSGGNCGNNVGKMVTVSWTQHFNVPNVFLLVPHNFLNSDRTITGVFRCE